MRLEFFEAPQSKPARSIQEIRDDWDEWLGARDMWLLEKADTTRRSYAYAWWDFFQRFALKQPRPTDNKHEWALWQVGSGQALAADGHLTPDWLEDLTLIAWKQEMASEGSNTQALERTGQAEPLKAGTINQRLSALSSYFSFCQ
jgi:hypothetical protein